MPLIDGQKVEFDPKVLAQAIFEGKKVQPDAYDYETNSEREKRYRDEWELIQNELWRLETGEQNPDETEGEFDSSLMAQKGKTKADMNLAQMYGMGGMMKGRNAG